ncbi:MAG: hypothetical protein QXT73_00350 [Candidatus Methanomethylicaceae archaeon]
MKLSTDNLLRLDVYSLKFGNGPEEPTATLAVECREKVDIEAVLRFRLGTRSKEIWGYGPELQVEGGRIMLFVPKARRPR